MLDAHAIEMTSIRREDNQHHRRRSRKSLTSALAVDSDKKQLDATIDVAAAAMTSVRRVERVRNDRVAARTPELLIVNDDDLPSGASVAPMNESVGNSAGSGGGVGGGSSVRRSSVQLTRQASLDMPVVRLVLSPTPISADKRDCDSNNNNSSSNNNSSNNSNNNNNSNSNNNNNNNNKSSDEELERLRQRVAQLEQSFSESERLRTDLERQVKQQQNELLLLRQQQQQQHYKQQQQQHEQHEQQSELPTKPLSTPSTMSGSRRRQAFEFWRTIESTATK